MNWITAGFLMFFSSIVTYLFVRRCSLRKIPIIYQNFAFFVIPTIVFLTLAFIQQVSLAVTWYQFIILAVTAIFFSYFGNVFSLRSLEYAPNPGYSLIISKSYVVFTTIAAIVLFGSTLTLRAAIAIMLIVACSALITIDKKGTVRQSHVRPSWLPLAIGAFFCWGMLSITSKYLLTIGVGTLTRLLYSMGLVTVFIVVEVIWKRLRWKKLSVSQVITLLGIGMFSAGFNWGMQEGFRTAPNIGYINAMNASSIGIVVIGAAIFFKDDLTPRKFLGVFGVIAGLILLVL